MAAARRDRRINRGRASPGLVSQLFGGGMLALQGGVRIRRCALPLASTPCGPLPGIRYLARLPCAQEASDAPEANLRLWTDGMYTSNSRMRQRVSGRASYWTASVRTAWLCVEGTGQVKLVCAEIDTSPYCRGRCSTTSSFAGRITSAWALRRPISPVKDSLEATSCRISSRCCISTSVRPAV